MALRVLMMGTDGVASHTVRALARSWRRQGPHPGVVADVQLVCPADTRVGRGRRLQPVPTKVVASEEGVPVHTLPRGTRSLKQWHHDGGFPVDPRNFDIAVVASFGYFLPRTLLEAFPLSGINMHPSLLPRYRGAAPLEHTLLNGGDVSGVSIIELHPARFDAGRILWQQEHPVAPTTTYPELAQQLGQLGADAIVEVLSQLAAGTVQGKDQDESLVTAAPKLAQRVGHSIDWSSWGCSAVHNLWRAVGDSRGIFGDLVSPSLPATGKPVRIVTLGVPVLDTCGGSSDNGHPTGWPCGSLRFDKKRKQLWLRCADGWIECKEMRVQGRKTVSGADFASGYVQGQGTTAGTVRLVTQTADSVS